MVPFNFMLANEMASLFFPGLFVADLFFSEHAEV